MTKENLLFADFKTPPRKVIPDVSCRSIPPRFALGAILTDEKRALMFLENEGVITIPSCCPKCKGSLRPMSTNLESKSRFVLRCRRRKCEGYSTSVFSGSVLQNCKYDKSKFVNFVYEWLSGTPATMIARRLQMGSATVTDWSSYMREAVAADMLLESECMIGGPGIVVEIDESKFGKRKYHVS